ncbi:TauD/TfdA family dioxygenase [Novosphingobium sp.]|uniref:TauD/TfdA dioxygenase family protein n=1 Tax=Novosphingobium sp. TaxID=1874826 RepID=UPI0025F5A955|nr:TauD/TfdA family dioxygenase [Novosphingobium sp.]
MREVRISPTGHFDNAARPYAHIIALPLSAAMGAEITGADVTRLSDAALAEMQDALWRHKMIYVRGARITHEQHRDFSARWGDFATDAYTQGVPGVPEVQPVIKEAETRTRALFGSGWHTDSAFLPTPPAISTLRSVEVPPFGGDTTWADCALALRMLSPAMQAMLAPLKVRMSAEANIATSLRLEGKALPFASEQAQADAIAGTAHPLVRTHPVKGEKSLYVDEVYACGIDGMTESESRPLLDFLTRHITQHAFTCRLRWEPDMLVMWDNRLCLHLAPNDYDGYRREMYRTTIAGGVVE